MIDWYSFICSVQVESAVRPLLDTYFPQRSGVQVLAQPGDFYVASAFTLAVNVIGKKMVSCLWEDLSQGEAWILRTLSAARTTWFMFNFITKCLNAGEKNEDTEFLYYMNEGVYGSFNHKLLGNTISAPSVHKVSRCKLRGTDTVLNWVTPRGSSSNELLMN